MSVLIVEFPSKYAPLTELYTHIGLERHAFKGIDKSGGFGEREPKKTFTFFHAVASMFFKVLIWLTLMQ